MFLTSLPRNAIFNLKACEGLKAGAIMHCPLNLWNMFIMGYVYLRYELSSQPCTDCPTLLTSWVCLVFRKHQTRWDLLSLLLTGQLENKSLLQQVRAQTQFKLLLCEVSLTVNPTGNKVMGLEREHVKDPGGV